ncbi:sigma factor-like helix-turn-helix DNA-binding protein [Yinghuangia aomiensis]
MDTAGFDAFYDRTAADVARHVYLLTASPHRAEHVTYRAYARAFAEWDTVETLPDPDAWVRMLASDMALDHLHRGGHRIGAWIPRADGIARKVRREAPEQAADGPPAPASDGTAPDVPDLTGDTDAAAAADRAWSADVALLRALRRLPARRRRAVVLRHHLGMSAEQVAVETEATTGTTVDRISRGQPSTRPACGRIDRSDPDSPAAHERLHAVMADLTGRYRPKLRAAPTVRRRGTGADGRAGRRRVRRRAGARRVRGRQHGEPGEAPRRTGGSPAVRWPRGPPRRAALRADACRAGRAAASASGTRPARGAQDVPDGMYELRHRGGAPPSHERRHLPRPARHRPGHGDGPAGARRSAKCRLARTGDHGRGEGRPSAAAEAPRSSARLKFLEKLAQGGPRRGLTFQLRFDDDAQVDKITEYSLLTGRPRAPREPPRA